MGEVGVGGCPHRRRWRIPADPGCAGRVRPRRRRGCGSARPATPVHAVVAGMVVDVDGRGRLTPARSGQRRLSVRGVGPDVGDRRVRRDGGRGRHPWHLAVDVLEVRADDPGGDPCGRGDSGAARAGRPEQLGYVALGAGSGLDPDDGPGDHRERPARAGGLRDHLSGVRLGDAEGGRGSLRGLWGGAVRCARGRPGAAAFDRRTAHAHGGPVRTTGGGPGLPVTRCAGTPPRGSRLSRSTPGATVAGTTPRPSRRARRRPAFRRHSNRPCHGAPSRFRVAPAPTRQVHQASAAQPRHATGGVVAGPDRAALPTVWAAAAGRASVLCLREQTWCSAPSMRHRT